MSASGGDDGGEGGTVRSKVNGKGVGSRAASATVTGEPKPARITVSTLSEGEVVDVFHRYAQDPNGYFMVGQGSAGFLHPSTGWTDGWTTAKVNEAWDVGAFDPSDYKTWVEIRWLHPSWYNRRGHKLDVNSPSMVTQRVLPEQIRQRNSASEAQQEPTLSLVHVRWGGDQPVSPVTEGAGGWGQIGSTPSDNYINGLEDHLFQAIGPTYEIISVFIQGSEELLKINAPLLRNMMRGEHVGALYFLWPISFQDGHAYPAYVDRAKLFELMVQMESTGIASRFPHQSHLYRIFASKEWTAQMCLHPLLHVPLTTQVARQALASDPAKAAAQAIEALDRLAKSRAAWNAEMGIKSDAATTVTTGVSKLGWSWEAMDVASWTSKGELAKNLTSLGEQPGSYVDQVFVQEWVDFDVEMRHFVVEPSLSKPATFTPKKIIYTVFKSREEGSFRNFDRYDREQCLQECFQNDDAALADAERQAQVLIGRWLEWLQAQTHEMPVVVRFDIMAKRLGPGKARVTTGELTELGGCFLGWPEGPRTVFSAMVRSFFKDPVRSD
eukprot:CAMPEP_0176051824 /NCGR_PEP_ID=MMETSP0120_2-20121206/25766_1 /TAXON_ID=160619 /ORGANISM="Kryptoperidinium foliaceum, Strain CCMP 1326" /LENGTH=552 /DNA_ID=CAMNT_0017385265 /DNA_START=44 /DNA_END=1702 /DNA_ORIENTATION=+